jgi:hypothetical protein
MKFLCLLLDQSVSLVTVLLTVQSWSRVSEYSSATHWLGYFILFTQWNKEIIRRDNKKRVKLFFM